MFVPAETSGEAAIDERIARIIDQIPRRRLRRQA